MKNKVKEKRLNMNLTQVELSEKVGVTSRTIISLEKGHYRPSIMLAYRLASIFDTNIEELFCLKENKEMEDKKYEDI
ncbi:TPA: helix-turn-helix transcriptional regulator [Listeria monocytogenes]|nr:helix-turn-helix transcriptional regulator [Listeria monocytogenes]